MGGTNKKHDVTYKIDPRAPQVCSFPPGHLSLLSYMLRTPGLQLSPQTFLPLESVKLHAA